MNATVSLRLPAFLGHLPELTHFALHFARQISMEQRQSLRLRLILEELFVNVCHHGGPEAVVSLILEGGEGYVHCHLADTGPAFDPLAPLHTACMSLPLEERSQGGVGLHLVQTMAYDAHYSRENATNVLRFSLPIQDCVPS